MVFAENFSLIYNKSNEMGKYQAALIIAKVTSLSQKDEPIIHPPISLLSCFNTICGNRYVKIGVFRRE